MEPTNTDLPFEHQMLHILRSYQRLQDEVRRLRAENRRLQSRCSLLSNAVDRRAVSGQSCIPDIDLTLECPPPTFDTPSAQ